MAMPTKPMTTKPIPVQDFLQIGVDKAIARKVKKVGYCSCVEWGFPGESFVTKVFHDSFREADECRISFLRSKKMLSVLRAWVEINGEVIK